MINRTKNKFKITTRTKKISDPSLLSVDFVERGCICTKECSLTHNIISIYVLLTKQAFADVMWVLCLADADNIAYNNIIYVVYFMG